LTNNRLVSYAPDKTSRSEQPIIDPRSGRVSRLSYTSSCTPPIYATDINRTGATNGQDILRLIDVLNGSGDFTPWLAQTLPPCP